MKSTSEVIINRPREEVLALIMQPGNFAKWQPGVSTFKLISGQQGQPGARAKVVIETHGLKLEMTETIVERRMPEMYSLKYEGRGVKNFVENRFYEVGPGQTRWVMVNTLDVSPLMVMVAPVIQDIVTKQNVESMQRFKAWAEAT